MREGARFVQLVALSRNPLIGCKAMTSIESFFATAARLGERLCRKYGSQDISWSEAARLVRRVARALISLGVKRGDAISIVGPNPPEWVEADLGAIAADAGAAAVYRTLKGGRAVDHAAPPSTAAAAVLAAQPLPEP